MVRQASNIARSERKTYLQIDDCMMKKASALRLFAGAAKIQSMFRESVFQARRGGARPRQETSTSCASKRLDRLANAFVSTGIENVSLLASRSLEKEREYSAGDASGDSSVTPCQKWEDLRNAPGNAEGSEAVKVPAPSLTKTATGQLDPAVVTTTSKKSSPFTSRELRSRPPTGAARSMFCEPPLLSWKVIR